MKIFKIKNKFILGILFQTLLMSFIIACSKDQLITDDRQGILGDESISQKYDNYEDSIIQNYDSYEDSIIQDHVNKQYQEISNVPNQEVYYVSPTGDDQATGKKEAPWKTLRKAASTLKAGETAIFEDGVYTENSEVNISNTGEEGKPIIFMAQNTHEATLLFTSNAKDRPKLSINNKKGIIIYGFEITQEEASDNNTADIFLRITNNSEDCRIIGNEIHHAFEDGIKSTQGCKNVIIEGNHIYDISHEGIDLLNVETHKVRYNKIEEVGRLGILGKGGVRNIEIANNIIKSSEVTLGTGIALGGVTNNTSPYGISTDDYEAFNSLAWNNILIAEGEGRIVTAMTFIGAADCHMYNNVIIGADNGIQFRTPPGIDNGWEWDPVVKDPKVVNNILMNIKQRGFYFYSDPVNLEDDYNLFYNVNGSIPEEENGLLQEPEFRDLTLDRRLLSTSPAIGSGKILPGSFDGFSGTEINIDFKTFDDNERGSYWNMGAY